ncbi:MAG: SPFH domain-containing protein [Chthoniobacterales bacterium]
MNSFPDLPKSRPQLPTWAFSLPVILILAVLFIPLYIWFFCRVEPMADEIVVLIRKTGKNPAQGAVLAAKDEKGIQLDVLAEGRHFLNPYTYSWEVVPVTDVPAGKLGVVTRLFGNNLPDGEIIAHPDSKGILSDVLLPGKHRINPYAFHVQMFDAITIRPGHIGVKVSLVGGDPLTGQPGATNTFIVPVGTKGVVSETVDPGSYYINPFLISLVEVNLQSQRFEMSGDDSIDFLTVDGFTITAEGTIEYGIKRDSAALLAHQVGDMDDIVQKIILPVARGFGRIEGSKNPALSYIVGETRQLFQDKLESHLREHCSKWGIDVRSVLIRNITPPDQIAGIIRERELAAQTRAMYDQQITQAQSKAQLARQQQLAVQKSEQVAAETTALTSIIAAKQDQEVRLTAAEQDLAVASLERDAAQAQARAILSRATGEQTVIQAQNLAEASVLQQQAAAFGDGFNYARHLFYSRTAPQIQSILTGDGEGSLGSLFNSYLPTRKP